MLRAVATLLLLLTSSCSLIFSEPSEDQLDAGVSIAEVGDYYIAAEGGSDTNMGTRDKPFATWQYAFAALQPGETLVALPGEYTQKDIGNLPYIDCAKGAIACQGAACRNGTADAPISVVSEYPGQAWLHTVNTPYQPALQIDNCSYWNVSGFRMSSGDINDEVTGSPGDVAIIRNSSFIAVRSLLLHETNRFVNASLLAIFQSNNILVENIEAYQFHRTAILVDLSTDVEVRNVYISGKEFPDIASGNESVLNCNDRGDVGILLRGTNDVFVDNVIVEAVCYGVNVRPGMAVSGPNVASTLSNILVRDATIAGVLAQSTCNEACDNDGNCDPNDCTTKLYTDELRLSHVAIANSDRHGVVLKGVVNASLTHITTVEMRDSGLRMDNGDTENAILEKNATVDHSLFVKGNYGIRVFSSLVNMSIEVSWLTAFLNTEKDFDIVPKVPPDQLNNRVNSLSGCIAYFPTNSALSTIDGGEGVGANIRYRTKKGLTTSEPIWNEDTFAFSCMAELSGYSYHRQIRCSTVHERLNVGQGGCPGPY